MHKRQKRRFDFYMQLDSDFFEDVLYRQKVTWGHGVLFHRSQLNRRY